jgi:mannose-6-phosphate isomerase-like protein (cupin superfamily)
LKIGGLGSLAKGEKDMIDGRNPTHINLTEKLNAFSEHWSPKIVARYNDNEVRLVKTSGEWVWHKHDETDELFLILEGEFDMDFRDGTVTVKPGELLIVPRGTEHRPAARRGEVKLLLIDPNDTPNTGDKATATQAVEL